jgi:hypothetical protein
MPLSQRSTHNLKFPDSGVGGGPGRGMIIWVSLSLREPASIGYPQVTTLTCDFQKSGNFSA